MRFVFLVADYETRQSWWRFQKTIVRLRLKVVDHLLRRRFFRVDQVFGGTLNLMRHCAVARACGADAVLATISGRDTYGDLGVAHLPVIRWQDRHPTDVCIIPDLMTDLIDDIAGPVIAYLQSPLFVQRNFDFAAERVHLWTDSPFMLEVCRRVYGPNKPIPIVPNIIDNQQFPFIPQSERQPGLIFAFPRKGADYINETERLYREMGGSYWQFERIDGLSIHQLAQQFRRPQAFLASAVVEGCALPPQESMASGIVVVGRSANGANFCMEHRQTAMIAETPEAAARCLMEIESADLRNELSQSAYRSIKDYFPGEKPSEFWREVIREFEV